MTHPCRVLFIVLTALAGCCATAKRSDADDGLHPFLRTLELLDSATGPTDAGIGASISLLPDPATVLPSSVGTTFASKADLPTLRMPRFQESGPPVLHAWTVPRRETRSSRQVRPTGRASARLAEPQYRLPGEFERHDVLLLGCDELASVHPDILTAIVAAAERRIPIVAIVSNQKARQCASEVLKQNDLPANSMRFLYLPHDSMWIRDYGPFSVKGRDGRTAIVDARYDGGHGRVNDDRIPVALAETLGITLMRAPIVLEGGNLLSNGEGLCLTTTSLLDHNADRRLDENHIGQVLYRLLGAEQTVFLEPLNGELSGHVDMFAMFTSPDTVVVGRYDPEIDPVNAVVLDRNADCLAQIRTRRGPLRVVRIPMPSNTDGFWRTHTNGILANGVLMVPIYMDVDTAMQDEAIDVLRQTMPGWKIEPIDSSGVIPFGGALHCISKCIVSSVNWREFDKLNAVAKPNPALQLPTKVKPLPADHRRSPPGLQRTSSDLTDEARLAL